MSTVQRVDREVSSTGAGSLRLAASLLLAGQTIFILVTQFHTGGEANAHHEIFAKYAESGDWKGVHVAQFGATALMAAGFVALSFALEARTSRVAWAARIGAVLAMVSLALYGVLQAIDGVGNKQVDQAWMDADAAQRAARFASAESMRWLEWGASSYHAYAVGLSLLLFAAALVQAHAIPRVIGYLAGLSGLAYLTQGWVAGSYGFTGTHSILIVATWVLNVVWMVWLVVVSREKSLRTERQGMPA